VKPTPSYPTLTFTSHDVRVKPNGRIEAAGELTLTYVERPVTLDATEAYSGPVYSDLVIVHTLTHPVTFELNVPAASLASSKRQLDVSASTAFSTEDFPGVREVLIDSDWPLLAQDEDCQAPSDPNEGYQGTLCTGTAVTAPVSTEMPSTVAEDYHGPDPASVPAGHKILIALDLHLLSDTQNAQHAGN
jgi:hypothetical protein